MSPPTLSPCYPAPPPPVFVRSSRRRPLQTLGFRVIRHKDLALIRPITRRFQPSGLLRSRSNDGSSVLRPAAEPFVVISWEKERSFCLVSVSFGLVKRWRQVRLSASSPVPGSVLRGLGGKPAVSWGFRVEYRKRGGSRRLNWGIRGCAERLFDPGTRSWKFHLVARNPEVISRESFFFF